MTTIYERVATLILDRIQPTDIINKLKIDRKQFNAAVDRAVAHGLISFVDVNHKQRTSVDRLQEYDQWRQKQPWPEGIRFEDSPQACIRQPMIFLRLS